MAGLWEDLSSNYQKRHRLFTACARGTAMVQYRAAVLVDMKRGPSVPPRVSSQPLQPGLSEQPELLAFNRGESSSILGCRPEAMGPGKPRLTMLHRAVPHS